MKAGIYSYVVTIQTQVKIGGIAVHTLTGTIDVLEGVQRSAVERTLIESCVDAHKRIEDAVGGWSVLFLSIQPE